MQAVDAHDQQQDGCHGGAGHKPHEDGPRAKRRCGQPKAEADKGQSIAERIGNQIVDMAARAGPPGQASEIAIGTIEQEGDDEYSGPRQAPIRRADGQACGSHQAEAKARRGDVIGVNGRLRQRLDDDDAGDAVRPGIVTHDGAFPDPARLRIATKMTSPHPIHKIWRSRRNSAMVKPASGRPSSRPVMKT